MPEEAGQRAMMRDVADIASKANSIAHATGLPVTTGHVLLAMVQLAKSETEYVLAAGVDEGAVIARLSEFQENPHTVANLYRTAAQFARDFGQSAITPKILLLCMLGSAGCCAFKIVSAAGADVANLRRDIYNDVPLAPRTSASDSGNESPLAAFGTDLTALARAGRLDPVVGRDSEIDRVFSVLGRKSKNNPVLLGAAGVGKTAIVEGVAQRIVAGAAPEAFRDTRLVALSLARLTSGTGLRGSFEERLQMLIDAVKRDPKIVIFLDELHTVVGAGAAVGGSDAADVLKPALARGELRCIGATTLDEYRERIEPDAALERRFQPVMVDPPGIEESVEILKGLRPNYERHHGVTYTDHALREAVLLSNRYVSDRNLPDKAIDLMDEAGSYAHQHGIPNVTSTEIATALEHATGIRVLTSAEEKERLRGCEEALAARIIGNPRFCRVMGDAVNGMFDPGRPKAVVLLVGPTGLGKTYSVVEFHKFMFGDERTLVRLDMSEFSSSFTVSRLIGSPPGYVGYDEGGQLTEKVRRHPATTILLDEIERAHSDVHELLFQVFEDGRLTDAQGRTVRFNETFIFMTSNVPVSFDGGPAVGFKSHADSERPVTTDDAIKNALRSAGFQDPFINRIDFFIPFTPFNREDLARIVDLMVGDVVGAQLAERRIVLDLSPEARAFLAERGYDAELGAKELRRVVRTHLLGPLGRVIDGFDAGDTILVRVRGEGLEFARR